jgi:hypothetical protein
MIAAVAILLAFPLGYFLSSRQAAMTTYAVAYLWAFTFQAVYLMPLFLENYLSFEGGRTRIVTPFPWDYGAVTFGILLAGLALVEAGHRVGRRRGRARALRPA